MNLAPGRYLLKAAQPAPGDYPVAKPAIVVVPPHQFVKVRILLDTGVR